MAEEGSDEEPPPLEDMSQFLPARNPPKQKTEEGKTQIQTVSVITKTDQNAEGFGQGLKKGFFSSKPVPKPSRRPAESEIIDVKPIASASKASSLRLPEVQQAMQYTEERQQEWLTPDLLGKFAENPILAKGFTDPKCMAAINDIREDPKAAMKKYGSDPDLRAFMSAFSTLMAEHFGELGRKKQAETDALSQQDPELQALLQDKGVKRILKRMQKGVPLDLHE